MVKKADFGEQAAAKIAALYKRYFETPAHSEHPPGPEYGDQYYHTPARLLLLSWLINAPLYSLPSQALLWIVPRCSDFPRDISGPTGRERLAEVAKREDGSLPRGAAAQQALAAPARSAKRNPQQNMANGETGIAAIG